MPFGYQPKLTPPAAILSKWALPFGVYRSIDGVYSTDFNIASVKPNGANIYYVDPQNSIGTASDANAGTAPSTALLSLSVALAKANCDQVVIQGLTSDFVARGTAGWGGVASVARSIAVTNATGFRFISAKSDPVVNTWTVNGTFPNVYQNARNSVPVQVVDTASLRFNNNRKAGTNNTAAFYTHILVGSIAAVAATPGSWFDDGTNTYIRPITDRVVPSNDKAIVLVQSGGFNGVSAGGSGLTCYVEGVDFVGGTSGFLENQVSAQTGRILAFKNCTFQASTQFNGLTVASFATCYLQDCWACYNYQDGFNYHSFESDGVTLGTSPKVLEVNCIAVRNGTTGSAGASDNASTSHDDCVVIRVNGHYNQCDDWTIADINFSRSWMLGSYIGDAIQSWSGTSECITGLDSSQIYLDGCEVKSLIANYQVNVTSSAAVFIRNMATTTLTKTGAGTLTTY